MPELPTLDLYTTEALALGYQEVLVREWTPLHETAEHEHPFDARGLVVTGEFWLSTAGQTQHLKVGDLFEVPQGQRHVERYGPEGAVYWAARRKG